MDTANIETLAYSNSVLFDNLQVLQPPIILPIISLPVINNYPTITNIINTSSNLEGDQVKQSQLINDYLKIYKMDHYNTRNLLNNVLFGYATVLSKQIIKSNFINNFIEYCANNLNESNVQIGINTTIELFKEPLGNEPAKTMLKSAYVKWFLRKDNGYAMDEKNTSIAINACINLFKEPLGDEPAKFMLKYAYIDWFTDASRFVGMDEENTRFVIKVCADIFKEQLGKEPAKLLLEEKYVLYFGNNNLLNSKNQEILKNSYWNMFNEVLVNYDTKPSQGEFRSHDSDLIGYGEKLFAGVSAGSEYLTTKWFLDNYSKDDKSTKELLGNIYKELIVDGCFAGIKDSSFGTNLTIGIFVTGHAVRMFKTGGIFSLFKGIPFLIAEDIVGLCMIPTIDKIKANYKECNSIVCGTSSNTSQSFNGGTHKGSGDNNSFTSQSFSVNGGNITHYGPITNYSDRPVKGTKD